MASNGTMAGDILLVQSLSNTRLAANVIAGGLLANTSLAYGSLFDNPLVSKSLTGYDSLERVILGDVPEPSQQCGSSSVVHKDHSYFCLVQVSSLSDEDLSSIPIGIPLNQ